MLVTECHADGLAQHDGGVFDGVVFINVHVTDRFYGEVAERVFCKRGQHVVVERHPGVDVAFTGAVKIDGQLDARLAGFAAHRCLTRGGHGSSGGAARLTLFRAMVCGGVADYGNPKIGA